MLVEELYKVSMLVKSCIKCLCEELVSEELYKVSMLVKRCIKCLC